MMKSRILKSVIFWYVLFIISSITGMVLATMLKGSNLNVDNIKKIIEYWSIIFIGLYIIIFLHELGHVLGAKFVKFKDIIVIVMGLKIINGKLKFFPREFLEKLSFRGIVLFKPQRINKKEDILEVRKKIKYVSFSGIIVNIFILIISFILKELRFSETNESSIILFIIVNIFVIFTSLLGDVRNYFRMMKEPGYFIMILIEEYFLYKEYELNFGDDDLEAIKFLIPILQKELDLEIEKINTKNKQLKALMTQTLVKVSLILEENFLNENQINDFLKNNKSINPKDPFANAVVDYEKLFLNLEKLRYTNKI